MNLDMSKFGTLIHYYKKTIESTKIKIIKVLLKNSTKTQVIIILKDTFMTEADEIQ